jgi:hypothetical protein
MKLMIHYHEDHYDCFRRSVSKLIGGDWNRKPFPAIPVLDSLLV